MATVLTVGDILEFKTFNVLKPQLAINTFYFIVSTVTVAGCTDKDVLTTMDAFANIDYPPLLPTQGEYFGSTIQKVWPVPVMGRLTATPSMTAGTNTNDILPSQTALVVTKQTGLPGRANRGRIYIPFPTEDHNDANGRPDAAYAALVNNLCTDMMNAQTVAAGGASLQIRPIIYHRGNHTWTIQDTWRVNAVWGTQRRRGDYGHVNAYPPYV